MGKKKYPNHYHSVYLEPSFSKEEMEKWEKYLKLDGLTKTGFITDDMVRKYMKECEVSK